MCPYSSVTIKLAQKEPGFRNCRAKWNPVGLHVSIENRPKSQIFLNYNFVILDYIFCRLKSELRIALVHDISRFWPNHGFRSKQIKPTSNLS